MLTPLEKNFYQPSPSVLKRPKAEIDEFYSKHKITVRGETAPATIFDFNEVGFPDYITTELSRRKFEEPTAIQSLTWPIAMSGKNLVGVAQTGSGKFSESCEIIFIELSL